MVGDGPEGCPLLLGAKDAEGVAGLKRKVCSWVWDDLVPPNDGQDGYPGLTPHAQVSYSLTEEAVLGWTLSLVFFGYLSLGQPYPLYFYRLRGLPQPGEEPVPSQRARSS